MHIGGLAAILGNSMWNRLADAGNRRIYQRRAVLMNEGDPVRHVAALLQGRVKVTRVDGDGNTTLLAVRGPGELLGDIGVLGKDRRTATVVAIERCVVSLIEAQRFLGLVRELGMERDLLAHLCYRISDNNRLRSEVAAHSAHLRVSRALVHLAEYAVAQMGTPPELPIDLGLDQTDISHVARLTRPTVTTELARLRDLGLVRTSRGHVVVVDLPGLRTHGNVPPRL